MLLRATRSRWDLLRCGIRGLELRMARPAGFPRLKSVADIGRESRGSPRRSCAGRTDAGWCSTGRPTVDFDNPDRSAIEDRDQCVASEGICSRVDPTTYCTCSSRINDGRPATAHRRTSKLVLIEWIVGRHADRRGPRRGFVSAVARRWRRGLTRIGSGVFRRVVRRARVVCALGGIIAPPERRRRRPRFRPADPVRRNGYASSTSDSTSRRVRPGQLLAGCSSAPTASCAPETSFRTR